MKKWKVLILASVAVGTLLIWQAPRILSKMLGGTIGVTTYSIGDQTKAERILILGNSLTFYNDAPALLVEMLKRADPQGNYFITSAAWPGFTLENHLARKDVNDLLEKKWNTVILQNHSGAAFEKKNYILNAMQQALPLVEKTGGKPISIMTYADKFYFNNQSVISQSYREAERELKVPTISAGDMFFHIQETNPEIELYSPDLHHPGANGTFIYCLAIFKKLFGNEKFAKLGDFAPDEFDPIICKKLYECVRDWDAIAKDHPEYTAQLPDERVDIAEYLLSENKYDESEKLLTRRLQAIDAAFPSEQKNLPKGQTLLLLAQSQMSQENPDKMRLAHDNLVSAEQIFLKVEGVNGDTVRRIKSVLNSQ
ncbi:MAG: hypothetical protein SFY67_01625 [Candidatus Melainabacteria bacterium]|nr:hypothetical protein [Candidatus Melainabacteria bacterium]